MASLVQEHSQRVAVGAGRFEAGMYLLDPLPVQPVGELDEAFGVVGEDFMGIVNLNTF
jgi:hypothetical protein